MHRLTLILALLLVPFVARGAVADWSLLSTPVFSNLGVDQGLPHPMALSIAQDSAGFIWVGTPGGLSRYDGYRFITFQHRDDDPTSLPTNFIGELAAGDQGRVWVADYTGNVLRYEPAIETFRSFPEPKEAAPRGFIERMVADGKGGVWLGTTAGLEHIDGDSGTVIRYRHLADVDKSTAADHVRAVTPSRDGSLWVSTDRGLWRRPATSERFEKFALPSAEISDSTLLDMNEDATGRLWFATAASEIGRIDTDGTVHKVAILPTTGARRVQRLSITQAGTETLWVGGFGSGVFILDMKNGRLQLIRHDPSVSVSLPYNSGRQLITDRTGRIWVTTLSGVSYISPQRVSLDSIFPSGRTSGISDVDIFSLAAAQDGKIWLGLSDQGVAVLDPVNGHIALLPAVTESPLSIVPGLAVTEDGTLWVGALGTPGLYRFDPATGHLKDTGWSPEEGAIYRRLIVHSGMVWVAAGPLVRFDPRTGQVRTYHHSDDPASLGIAGVVFVAPADAEHLWVTTSIGLDLFDVKTEKFRHFVHVDNDPRSMPAGVVTAITIDHQGRLWAGTLGNGIGIGTPDANGGFQFRRLTVRDGLPTNNISGLLPDNFGRIWASTANGLAVIDAVTLAVQPLDRADGLAIAAYGVNSSLRLPDGTLLFGGRGLTVVHPERFDRPAFDPPVVVTGLRVNGESRPVGRADLSVGPPLILGAHEDKFEVEFAALDFSASETLHYSYRLSGFDHDWISVDASRRVAAYTNLPPGHYALQMRGGDRAGAWSRTLSMQLVVLPAWWQTWWFRSLAALAMVALIVLLIRARTAILRRRSQELERLVARQTSDLTESNVRLAESNARLADLAAQDPLTGLLNRRAFVDLADRELERASRYRRPTSLLMIDIDHFKLVNDTHGHGAGDEVLRALAAQIRELLRSSDFCARLGGEELAVLMPETQPASALKVAALLREAIAGQERHAAAVCFHVTISIGVATRLQNENLTQLLERADRALYAAKTGGRNRIVMAGEEDLSQEDLATS